jgi:hypothetical protein
MFGFRNIFPGTQQLEFVEKGHVAFAGYDVTGKAVGLAEIGVSSGDNTAN